MHVPKSNSLISTYMYMHVHLAPSGSGPGRSTLPAIGSSVTWKAALWTRLDRLVNSILKAYSQIHQLYLVLTKKRDPITQVTFLESIAEVLHDIVCIAQKLSRLFKPVHFLACTV